MVPESVVPIQLLLATTAKVLCSAVFVSGRDPAEAFANSAVSALHGNQLPEALAELARYEVDREHGQVHVRLQLDDATAARLVAAHRAAYPGFGADWDAETRRLAGLGLLTRSARLVGDQGCQILPMDGDQSLHFTPVPVATKLPAAATLPWPMGDAPPAHSQVSAACRAQVGAAIDAAFAETQACNAAVLAVHRGEIVGERYAQGIGPDTQLESWSMGKSVMATLIGLLVGRGLLALDEPAPVDAWREPGDPRSRITLRHLLNMSSGLRCTGQDDARAAWRHGLPEHFLPYGEALNVAEFATARPSEFEPGTVGRYRNCDSLTLAWLFRKTVAEKLGADPLSWPQAELFDRIGVRRQTLETDRWGSFIISGFDYGTPRNWARLGLLYLNDGIWQGERVLPEGWTTFATTPAPAWEKGNYGGQIWLNRTGEYDLPRDAFYMAGGGGQHVFIVPSLDLVIVRMGHSRGYAHAKPVINALAGRIARACGYDPSASRP